MTLRIPILLIFMTFMALISWAQDQKSKRKSGKKPNANWELYLKTSKQYCPNAYYILSHVSKGDHYAKYGRDSNNDTSRITYMGTVVHEACHGLNYEIGEAAGTTQGYFIGDEKGIAVEKTKVYNAYELNELVPDSLQNKMQRYQTYLGRKQPLLSSQCDGIFGLLDEFTAYYHDSFFSFSLKPWYETTFGFKSPDPWVDLYIPRIGAEITAFYEFRIYIAWYLANMKKKYPEQYQQIMANQKLREVFTLIYDRYELLAKNYETEVTEISRLLNEKGFKTTVSDQSILVHKEFSASGTGHFLNVISWLKTIYTPELDATLKEFRLN